MKLIRQHDGASFAALRQLIIPIHNKNKLLYEKLFEDINRCEITLTNILQNLKFAEDSFEETGTRKYIKEGHNISLDLSWDDRFYKTSLYFTYSYNREKNRTKAWCNGGVIFHGSTLIFNTDDNNNLIIRDDIQDLKSNCASFSTHT